MSGGSSKGGDQTVTQTTKPWNADALGAIGKGASYLLSHDIGFKPFEGPTYTPYSSQTLAGLQQTENLAKQGNASIGAANDFVGDMTKNGGMSSGLLGAMKPFQDVSSGAQSINSGNYADIYGRAQQPSASSQYLTETAQGKYLDGNPYLMGALDRGASEIASRSKMAAAAGGRYGSGAAAQTTANAVGDYYRPALMQNYENERGRMMSAAGQIDQANQGLLGQQLGAAQGMAGVEGANIANRVNAASQEAGMWNQGLNRGLQSAALAPTLDAARYNDANRLMGVGQAYDAKTQEALNDAMSKWDAWQNRPWNMLNAASGIANGAASYGGSSSQTSPGRSPLLGGASGALAGGGLYSLLGGSAALGPWGLGLPALGGLLGAFG